MMADLGILKVVVTDVLIWAKWNESPPSSNYNSMIDAVTVTILPYIHTSMQ